MIDKWINRLEMNERFDERFDFISSRLLLEKEELELEEEDRGVEDREKYYYEVKK